MQATGNHLTTLPHIHSRLANKCFHLSYANQCDILLVNRGQPVFHTDNSLGYIPRRNMKEPCNPPPGGIGENSVLNFLDSGSKFSRPRPLLISLHVVIFNIFIILSLYYLCWNYLKTCWSHLFRRRMRNRNSPCPTHCAKSFLSPTDLVEPISEELQANKAAATSDPQDLPSRLKIAQSFHPSHAEKTVDDVKKDECPASSPVADTPSNVYLTPQQVVFPGRKSTPLNNVSGQVPLLLEASPVIKNQNVALQTSCWKPNLFIRERSVTKYLLTVIIEVEYYINGSNKPII